MQSVAGASPKQVARVAALCALILAVAAGCSSDPAEVSTSPGKDSGPDQDAAPDAVPDGTTDTSPPQDAAPDQLFLDTGDNDGSVLEGCATESAEVELLPLDLYIMLDKSGSMTGAKWTAVKGALNAFAADPTMESMGVGLQFFPLGGAGVCDFTAYADPEVPIATLGTNATAIADSLASVTPDGETPTLPALQGAVAYAKAWATDNPDHTIAVILATDGEPNVCGSTVQKVAQAANVGASTDPPVRTFVIGVGASLTSLEEIAAAGDTGQAFLVDDSNQNTQQQFIAALESIRGKALTCEYGIPAPEAGSIDVNKVNVVYTSSDGEVRIVSKVAGVAGCEGNDDGWYYDDPSNPTKVILCDSACDIIKGDSEGKVDVVFGCVTVVA
jgi:Mg-chelatase subunit ChlD